MNLENLKSDLEAILAIENEDPVDWQRVEANCLKLIVKLNNEREPKYPHNIVYHFLDDPDIRRKDAVYANMQRERLIEWLADA